MDVVNARMKEQYENLRFAHTFADVLPNLKNQRKRKMTIRQNARIKS
jgi:hypothetical protein